MGGADLGQHSQKVNASYICVIRALFVLTFQNLYLVGMVYALELSCVLWLMCSLTTYSC
jgi:hypothetical protein